MAEYRITFSETESTKGRCVVVSEKKLLKFFPEMAGINLLFSNFGLSKIKLVTILNDVVEIERMG